MNEIQSPIEFDCPHCNSRLKVPGEIAGRQAKCPNCQQVVQVPTHSTVGESVAPEMNSPTVPATTGTVPGSLGITKTPIQPVAGDSGSIGTDSIGQSGHQPVAPSSNPVAPTQVVPSTAPAPTSAPAQQVVGEETETRKLYTRILEEVAKIFVGQDDLVRGTLVALFSGGHVLIESVPGLGKTLFIRTLGRILGCEFGRIQFTADLMPSDITGAPVFNMKTQEFNFRPGPIFTQLLLADEINRSPAKTHAALLEIMQEKNVTVDGTTHELAPPFLVMATQNPLESDCLLYTSPSPRDLSTSRMPSSA